MSEIIDDGRSMKVAELKKLYKAMDGIMAARFLEVLWFEYSSDNKVDELIVNKDSIKIFKIWLKSGNQENTGV